MKITICMGSACFARGNEENLRVIESFMREHEVEANIELAGNCCRGACAQGPNVAIDDVCHHKMDKETLLSLLNDTLSNKGVNT